MLLRLNKPTLTSRLPKIAESPTIDQQSLFGLQLPFAVYISVWAKSREHEDFFPHSWAVLDHRDFTVMTNKAFVYAVLKSVLGKEGRVWLSRLKASWSRRSSRPHTSDFTQVGALSVSTARTEARAPGAQRGYLLLVSGFGRRCSALPSSRSEDAGLEGTWHCCFHERRWAGGSAQETGVDRMSLVHLPQTRSAALRLLSFSGLPAYRVPAGWHPAS